MKKIISILLTTSMLAGSAAMPFTAIAAETATTASQASEAAKTGTLTVTAYHETSGGENETGETNENTNLRTFTVQHIYDTYVIVSVDGSRFIRDLMFLYKKDIDSNIDPVLGMKLTLGYTETLDTYPGHFGGVHDVKVVSEDGGLIKGDSNCDGQVDMADVVFIMQALANPDRYGEKAEEYQGITALGKLNGDMNGDGLTVNDALAIQKKLLGLDEAETELDITRKKISDFVDENKINCIVIPKDRIPENYADKYIFINNNYSTSDEKEALNKFILQNDIDRNLLKYIPYDLDDDHEVNKIVEKLYWYILDNDIKASVSRFAGSNDPKFEDKVVISYRWQDEGVEEKINAFLEENNVDPELVIGPVLE